MRPADWIVGPVLVWELTAAARTKWFYIGRAAFVALLLAGLGLVWSQNLSGREVVSHRVLAQAGETAIMTMLTMQLVVVLFTAPGVMVGSIGADRLRGLLPHLLVTDLSNREIVLGKLVGRLTPLMLMILCSMPVAAVLLLFGGVSPAYLACAYCVLFLTLLLAGAFGLACSLFCEKMHEALILCYLFIALGLLAWPVGFWLGRDWTWVCPFMIVTFAANPASLPDWLRMYALFTLVSSLVLIVLVIVRLRASCATERGARRVVGSSRLGDWRRRVLPGPDLDGNPVLWREWRRRRPTRTGVLTLALYLTVAGGFSVSTLGEGVGGRGPADWVKWGNGFQACMGLLIITVLATTALSEERARGGLDLLLTTPLSTKTILWGKWLGTMRWSLGFAAFPALVLAGRAYWSGTFHGAKIAVLALVLCFAYSAALTSCGLLIAVRASRQNRAMANALLLYVLLVVGWLCLIPALSSRNETSEAFIMLSPFWSISDLTEVMQEPVLTARRINGSLTGAGAVLFVLAVVTLYATRATEAGIERYLGRMPCRK